MTDNNSSRRLSAAYGWHWLREASRAFSLKPIQLLGVTLFYLIVMGFLSAFPYGGMVFAALFMPFGTAFIGRSTHEVLKGGTPLCSDLKQLFGKTAWRRSLSGIGIIYGFILVTINALYGYLAADSIALWKITADNRLDWASVQANIPWGAIVAGLIIYIPGLMAVWFAPLLATEKNMGPGKAVFYSFFGCLRNILPVLVLIVLVAVMIIAFGLVASLLFEALGSVDAVVSFILMPLSFLLLTFIYSAYWPMYASLFEDVE